MQLFHREGTHSGTEFVSAEATPCSENRISQRSFHPSTYYCSFKVLRFGTVVIIRSRGSAKDVIVTINKRVFCRGRTVLPFWPPLWVWSVQLSGWETVDRYWPCLRALGAVPCDSILSADKSHLI